MREDEERFEKKLGKIAKAKSPERERGQMRKHERFAGNLEGEGGEAKCVVTVDEDGAAYMSDENVVPRLPDGEYKLEVNGVFRRAIRSKGVWKSHDY